MSPDALVASTLPCTACGYNLRMQRQDARCPECGQEVAVSLRFSLVPRGPAYLRSLASAAFFSASLNLAAIATTGAFILTMFSLALTRFRGDPAPLVVILFISYTIISVLHIVAAFRAMAPMPTESHPVLGTLMVGSGVTFAVATLAPLVMGIAVANRPGPTEGFGKALFFSWSLLFPALPIFVLAVGFRYAALCKNAGIHSLVGWHRWSSRVFSAALLVISGAFWIFTCVLLIEPRGHPPEWWPILTVAILFYGSLLVSGIAFIVCTILLFRTANRFRRLAHDLSLDDPNDMPRPYLPMGDATGISQLPGSFD